METQREKKKEEKEEGWGRRRRRRRRWRGRRRRRRRRRRMTLPLFTVFIALILRTNALRFLCHTVRVSPIFMPACFSCQTNCIRILWLAVCSPSSPRPGSISTSSTRKERMEGEEQTLCSL